MLRRDDSGGRNPMRTARGFRAACLMIGLALVAVGCAGRDGDAGGDGVGGGTLQVLSSDPEPTLDTAVFYYPPIARAYARTLYGYNLAGPPDRVTEPVPDIADGPAQLSADRRSYTFRLRAGASRFGAGKATGISGLSAPDARTLIITLDRPAGDFLSILTLAYFAPVPGEYARS